MQFYYKVATVDGRRDEGIIRSRNERRAREDLLRRYAKILVIKESHEAKELLLKPFKAPMAKVAVFFRRLGTMLGAGVQLADALEFLCESETDDGLREAIEFLSKEVMSGNSISGAMRKAKFRRVFDPVSIGMVQMGEQTGELTKVVDKIADQMERNLKLTRSIASAMTYPCVLFVVILLMGALFTLVLGPGEGGLFSAFGEEIPWATRVVQQVSEVVRRPWLIALGIGVLVSLFLTIKGYIGRNPTARMKFDATLLQLPLLGDLIHKAETARLLYVMGDGLSVGLPALKCMHMARDVCGNDKMRREFTRVITNFSEGETFADALNQASLFPHMVISMIEVGMESGKLDIVMNQVCVNYEEDVQMTLENVTRLAEPLLLAFAGAMAAFLALATLLPIINMVDTL